MNKRMVWSLARRYWFDALALAAVGVGLAEVTLTQDDRYGPKGPLWFDLLAILGITLPLFLRRRFPLVSLAWRSMRAP